MSEHPEHVERMITEFNELYDRGEKLTSFITGSIFSNLSDLEQRLLIAQAGAMTTYMGILSIRLANAGVDVEGLHDGGTNAV